MMTLERRVSTVGRVHPHVEIRIADPATGKTLPRGAAGEFCTRGYSVMRGYWDDETRTREAIDAEGWMHTGDLARMDDGGIRQHRRMWVCVRATSSCVFLWRVRQDTLVFRSVPRITYDDPHTAGRVGGEEILPHC